MADTKVTSATIPQEKPDLGTEEGVRTYLARTPFEIANITSLSGGTANYVFRLHLITPYQDHETLVFKHAKPYVKNSQEIAFDVERQVYEVEALRRVRAWLPADSVVTVPEVHLFDEEANAIVMDDTGPESIDLKAFMQNGGPSLSVAKDIGRSIGVFLGKLHKWGQGNKELCAAVRGNAQAKAMSAWISYGWLKGTLTGAAKLPFLTDPPLDVAESDLKVIDQLVEETTRSMLQVEDSFVMGDFWPGNLMVRLDKAGGLKQIYVLDWELTKEGLTGCEVGQFLAEIHLLRRCNAEVCKDTASLVLEHFLEEYKMAAEPDSEVVRRAVVHWGTHMAVLGARVKWGDKEMSRAVVLEGVRILVDGYEGKLDLIHVHI